MDFYVLTSKSWQPKHSHSFEGETGHRVWPMFWFLAVFSLLTVVTWTSSDILLWGRISGTLWQGFIGKLGIVLKQGTTRLNSFSGSFISCSQMDHCEPVQSLPLVCEGKRWFFYQGTSEFPIKEEKWCLMEGICSPFSFTAVSETKLLSGSPKSCHFI